VVSRRRLGVGERFALLSPAESQHRVDDSNRAILAAVRSGPVIREYALASLSRTTIFVDQEGGGVTWAAGTNALGARI
jgi:hypothetical protein